MSALPSFEAPLARIEAREGHDEIPQAVRAFLDSMRDHLQARQREGAPGSEVNALHSDLMDRLIRRLFAAAESEYFAEGHEEGDRVAVLAVGGYARREMSVYSDVDLLLLHAGRLSPFTTRIAERIQYWLWDGGLTVGCATRTIDDTVRLARDDSTVFTGILDTRFLAGDPVFFHEFTDTLRRRLLSDVGQFLKRQEQAIALRHASFGDSLYLLQPNIKEGAGGLRDYHAAIWAMRAVLPSTRGLDDLLHYGLLTEAEMGDYKLALDFLWRVRNELHLLVGRRFDQMSFDHQERIAGALGYRSDDTTILPVEQFMGDYYRFARVVRNHSEIVIEQCVDRARPPRRRKVRPVPVEYGFELRGGKLGIPRAGSFPGDPQQLLRAFAVAQRHDVPLTRFAKRLIRENLHFVDETFRSDPTAAALMLGILNAETRVMRTLMAMNEVGLLGAYWPEWEHIVCRWQHVMYHTYTVDIHSIFLVEELRRLWRGKYDDEQPELAELVRSLPDRLVLFLGCLFHDLGKGLGGDHSALGESRARDACERMGLDAADTDRVAFLVRHHLVMSHISQRRDLTDMKTLLEFARLVGDRQNLRLLYLLTFADMRASSKTAWTEWKGSLLRELYERTGEVLESGQLEPEQALETIQARITTRKRLAEETLLEAGWQVATIEAAIERMPSRYFVAHTPKQIARHLTALREFKPNEGPVTRVRAMRGGFSELIVCCDDVAGLYSKVAGTLTVRDINILASDVYTTKDGVALEVYRVTTPVGDAADRERAWNVFSETLRGVLAGEIELRSLLHKRAGTRFGAPVTPSRLPPAVSISNDVSDRFTVIDVSTNDRLGLLYDLTSVLSERSLSIHVSKAATVLDQVADTFYVRDGAGKKLADAEAIESLRTVLYDAATRDFGEA